jgi:hypothetical protein
MNEKVAERRGTSKLLAAVEVHYFGLSLAHVGESLRLTLTIAILSVLSTLVSLSQEKQLNIF